MDIIDSNTFDKHILSILKNKKGKNVVTGRFDIENIDLSKKPHFIIAFLLSFKFIKGITYKIHFWEKDDVLINFFNINFNNKKFDIDTSYRNGKLAGVLFIDDAEIDELFLKLLLINHFNYEMAKEPSLNIRIQISISQEKFITVLDIYDDRGLDVFYLNSF